MKRLVLLLGLALTACGGGSPRAGTGTVAERGVHFQLVPLASGWILHDRPCAIAGVALPLTIQVVGVTVTTVLVPLVLFTRAVGER